MSGNAQVRILSSNLRRRPANAISVWQAKQQGIPNLSILVLPSTASILQSARNRVQGFLGPGHVCTVMGYREYDPIAACYKVPIIITGFERIAAMGWYPLGEEAAVIGELTFDHPGFVF